MGYLIDDLLAFSRVGHSEMQKSEVNLDELVRRNLGRFSGGHDGRQIGWMIHPLPPLLADRALLRLVLVNLISNALKFTGGRTDAKIEIGCAPAVSGETVIFIRDNGAGFDPKNAENSLACSNACTVNRTLRARGSDWLLSSASFVGTGDGHGRKARHVEQ